MLALVLPWVVLAAWITAGGRTELRQADCIIVLGARALADGTPGPTLRARVDQGVRLWKAGWSPFLLMTGGRGQDGTVEGEVSRDYAASQGVPVAAMEFEGSSHNTRENFLYAREIMVRRGWHTCLVVTDPFHERRSLMLARDFGLEPFPAPTFEGPNWRRWSNFSLFTVRECFSMLKYGWQSLYNS